MQNVREWLDFNREVRVEIALFGASPEVETEVIKRREAIGTVIGATYGEKLRSIVNIGNDAKRFAALEEFPLPPETLEAVKEMRAWWASLYKGGS